MKLLDTGLLFVGTSTGSIVRVDVEVENGACTVNASEIKKV